MTKSLNATCVYGSSRAVTATMWVSDLQEVRGVENGSWTIRISHRSRLMKRMILTSLAETKMTLSTSPMTRTPLMMRIQHRTNVDRIATFKSRSSTSLARERLTNESFTTFPNVRE